MRLNPIYGVTVAAEKAAGAAAEEATEPAYALIQEPVAGEGGEGGEAAEPAASSEPVAAPEPPNTPRPRPLSTSTGQAA